MGPGTKLLKAAEESGAEYDVAAAQAYKTFIQSKIVKVEKEVANLPGWSNRKERPAKGKFILFLKNEHKYVDACKVVKGLAPKFGHFAATEAARPEIETEGLNDEEQKELEHLWLRVYEQLVLQEGMMRRAYASLDLPELRSSCSDLPGDARLSHQWPWLTAFP